MKTTLAIFAWFGLAITVLATLPAFSSSDTWVRTGQLGAGVGYGITFFIGILGFALALIGGFIAKPKYLWLGAIIVGMLYIVSFYGFIIPSPSSVPVPNGHKLALSVFLLDSVPGMVAIIAGVILLAKTNQKAPAALHQVFALNEKDMFMAGYKRVIFEAVVLAVSCFAVLAILVFSNVYSRSSVVHESGRVLLLVDYGVPASLIYGFGLQIFRSKVFRLIAGFAFLGVIAVLPIFS